mmetsp:Transcript_40634/g.79479  ORF Transcript_40634/g.79479 Transcript_40634/m.79479 type:complete len:212 (-) Transcript_40634:630-1265(-)
MLRTEKVFPPIICVIFFLLPLDLPFLGLCSLISLENTDSQFSETCFSFFFPRVPISFMSEKFILFFRPKGFLSMKSNLLPSPLEDPAEFIPTPTLAGDILDFTAISNALSSPSDKPNFTKDRSSKNLFCFFNVSISFSFWSIVSTLSLILFSNSKSWEASSYFSSLSFLYWPSSISILEKNSIFSLFCSFTSLFNSVSYNLSVCIKVVLES